MNQSKPTFEHFEYPCSASTQSAPARAKVRLEQVQRDRVVVRGRTDSIRVTPGRSVRAEGASDAAINQRYVVRFVVHDLRLPTPHSPGMRYSNRVTMAPADMPVRPPLARLDASVEGMEVAATTGPRGEEIHVDDLGRVKLRFFWDRSGITDDRSSTWIRTLQMPLGAAMFLPRVGWEVPVVFLDGNPDRPVVLGRLYNATAVVPYSLPGASATTSFQSATSPGAAGTNEIRMGDDASREELFVHASRDQSVSVGGRASTTVGASETHDVGLSYALTVDASQTHSVGASQAVNVATDYVTGVKGGRCESIGAAEIVGVGGNRFVGVSGSYAEVVGAAYALQCNQSNTSVSGGLLQAIGGPLALVSGLGTSESVAAARFEVVGGGRLIVAVRSFSESVTGFKNVTAGATTESAGGKVVTSVKAGGVTTVGGGASVRAGGDVILEAATIRVDVGGSLSAGALNLSGGSLKAKSGKTNLRGNIQRKGGGKIG